MLHLLNANLQLSFYAWLRGQLQDDEPDRDLLSDIANFHAGAQAWSATDMPAF